MGWLLLSHGHANPASRVPYCPPLGATHKTVSACCPHRAARMHDTLRHKRTCVRLFGCSFVLKSSPTQRSVVRGWWWVLDLSAGAKSYRVRWSGMCLCASRSGSDGVPTFPTRESFPSASRQPFLARLASQPAHLVMDHARGAELIPSAPSVSHRPLSSSSSHTSMCATVKNVRRTRVRRTAH